NIPLRLHHVNGDDHAEVDDHELLTLREGVNDQMTGIELKYLTSLAALLRGAIAADPFPMSPRGHQLRAILERLRAAYAYRIIRREPERTIERYTRLPVGDALLPRSLALTGHRLEPTGSRNQCCGCSSLQLICETLSIV